MIWNMFLMIQLSLTGFSGMEVQPQMFHLLVILHGEVSNMIAPVQSMIGDTLVLNWVYYDWYMVIMQVR